MIYVLYAIHVLMSIFLILVVLLQQGKGADLSVFGGGGSQAAFGARGAATVLHKLTVICFVLFILTTLTIGILQTRSAPSLMGGLDTVAVEEDSSGAPTAPAGGSLPAGDTQSDGAGADGTTGSESDDASESSGGEVN